MELRSLPKKLFIFREDIIDIKKKYYKDAGFVGVHALRRYIIKIYTGIEEFPIPISTTGYDNALLYLEKTGLRKIQNQEFIVL